MIEYLIALWLVKYRNLLIEPRVDPIDRSLEPYAGLDYEPPQRERPNLRVVK